MRNKIHVLDLELGKYYKMTNTYYLQNKTKVGNHHIVVHWREIKTNKIYKSHYPNNIDLEIFEIELPDKEIVFDW